MCVHGVLFWRWWRWMALGVVVCLFAVVGCLRCSLGNNNIGDDGARAIGAGLQYLPSLTTLKYVRNMGHAEEAKEE